MDTSSRAARATARVLRRCAFRLIMDKGLLQLSRGAILSTMVFFKSTKNFALPQICTQYALQCRKTAPFNTLYMQTGF
jgi:hypothetical protein